MRSRSFFLLVLGLLALFFADLEVSTLDPGTELGRMLKGVLFPNFKVLRTILPALVNTLIFALLGTFLGCTFGVVLALFYKNTLVRVFAAFIRSIHELFWGFLLLPMVGLNPLCGILAIAIPYTGIFAKVYSEILEVSDPRPLEAIPRTADKISFFCYGFLPRLWSELKHYTSYRFECALRSSAILGFIGLPTLGYHLETWVREGQYAMAFGLLFLFYGVITSLKVWMKPKLVPIWLLLALVMVPKETQFSVENTLRFLTTDIIPWPIREGFGAIKTLHWAKEILLNSALEGSFNSLVLTQISLSFSGILALVLFPLSSVVFVGGWGRKFGYFGLVILRTTPEYLLAYILVQLLGPSMLPAVLALSLHNGGILGHLSALNADRVILDLNGSKNRVNKYFFEILPQIYGQFLSFLLYRWEVIFRESAILGVLGIYSLGFFIDSAIVADRWDEAMLLIIISGILNIAIDQLSSLIRKGV